METCCIFDGQEYLLAQNTDLFGSIDDLPEEFGVFPDHGRGTDAYRSVRFVLNIDDGQLFLRDLSISSIGDWYPPINNVSPSYSGSHSRALYSDLNLKVEKSGELCLLRNQLVLASDISGWNFPSQFELALRLDFVEGVLVPVRRESPCFGKLHSRLAHDAANAYGIENWRKIKEWVLEHTWFEWPKELLRLLSSAADGCIKSEEALALLDIREIVRVRQKEEDQSSFEIGIIIRKREYFQGLLTWLDQQRFQWADAAIDVISRWCEGRLNEYDEGALLLAFICTHVDTMMMADRQSI